MKPGPLLIAGAIVIVAGVGAYAIRAMAPSATAIQEGAAYTSAHNKMMSAMMGSGVIYSGDADADFAMLLLPHYQGAIDMANVELKYGTNADVRSLAQRVVFTQRAEMDQLSGWRKTHPAVASAASAAKDAYLAANTAMMNGMMGGSMQHSGDADRDFVKLMIPHHQGAIEMANIEMKYGADAELRGLAQNVVTAEQAEIAEMERWLKANGR